MPNESLKGKIDCVYGISTLDELRDSSKLNQIKNGLLPLMTTSQQFDKYSKMSLDELFEELGKAKRKTPI